VTAAEHSFVIGYALGLADELGLSAWHWADSRQAAGQGWPDLTFCGRGRFMYREVKTGMAKRTAAQISMGYQMIAAGYDYSVWRMVDYQFGRIERELRALAASRGIS
jgi:hypothetical protein